MGNDKYIHEETLHNTESAEVIVPLLMQQFQPASVLDVGCGIGTFLKVFKSHGVQKVLGIDGSWVNRDLLSKYIAPEEFMEKDMEQPFEVESPFDLVISFEVAEHLSSNAADAFVQSLVNSGKVIVFSAAIPHQGGQNHINEQWPDYWREKFEKQDYKAFDILRPLIWDNSKVFYWYRQNMVVYAHKSVNITPVAASLTTLNTVHPELFTFRATQLRKARTELANAMQGKLHPVRYLKLFLKSLFKRS